MLMAQAELTCGAATLVCWLPIGPKLKLGAVVELHGDDYEGILWRITKLYKTTMPRVELNKSWKVGGLN